MAQPLHPLFAAILADAVYTATLHGSFRPAEPVAHGTPEQGEQAAADLREHMAAELGEVAL